MYPGGAFPGRSAWAGCLVSGSTYGRRSRPRERYSSPLSIVIKGEKGRGWERRLGAWPFVVQNWVWVGPSGARAPGRGSDAAWPSGSSLGTFAAARDV